jgi:co-chaperonin GroES (HSP10)
MSTFKPMSDIVVVEKLSQDVKTSSGIICETVAKDLPPFKGKVISIGSDITNVSVDDIVVYDAFVVNDFICEDGRKVDLVLEQNILGKMI